MADHCINYATKRACTTSKVSTARAPATPVLAVRPLSVRVQALAQSPPSLEAHQKSRADLVIISTWLHNSKHSLTLSGGAWSYGLALRCLHAVCIKCLFTCRCRWARVDPCKRAISNFVCAYVFMYL